MSAQPGPADQPTPASVTFVTTEHFTLQGARAQTISEANGRMSVFLGAVSGGLIALGLMANAVHVGTAFYALALTLLPTLSFVGLVTFNRVLQNGLEDLIYVDRIARLRGFYFEHAPELDEYLLSVSPERRMAIEGAGGGGGGWWQHFLTVAGMAAVITSVLAGASVALLAAAMADHSLAGALAAGGAVALVALGGMMGYLHAAWARHLRRFDIGASTGSAAAYPQSPGD
jgi:hypothetical protein